MVAGTRTYSPFFMQKTVKMRLTAILYIVAPFAVIFQRLQDGGT